MGFEEKQKLVDALILALAPYRKELKAQEIVHYAWKLAEEAARVANEKKEKRFK